MKPSIPATTPRARRINRRQAAVRIGALAAAGLSSLGASARARTFKVGLVLPMTGPFASTGKQIDAGVRTYMAQYGASAGGVRIEVVCRCDDQHRPGGQKSHCRDRARAANRCRRAYRSRLPAVYKMICSFISSSA